MVKAHVAHIHFNEFTFRTHLGVLHLTSSQYNVPIYNYFNRLQEKSHQKKIFSKFLKYAYEPFCQGLEGVNIAAISTLIHPKFPIVEKVFTIDLKKALRIVAEESQRVDLNHYDPQQFIKDRKLEDLVEGSSFYFDVKYYNILKDYVHSVYVATGMPQISNQLRQEINSTIAKVAQNRPQIGQQLDVFFANLVFIWTVYHCHTFSNLVISGYIRFRPGMMQEPISEQDLSFSLPQRIMFENQKLNLTVTFKDTENFLMDVMARTELETKQTDSDISEARNELETKQTDPKISEARNEFETKLMDDKISNAASKALREIRRLDMQLQKVNEERDKKNLFKLTWFDPSRMQASLNI